MKNFYSDAMSPSLLAILTVMLIFATTTIGCSETEPSMTGDSSIQNNDKKEVNLPQSVFVGCYTVSKSEPAQIKIDQQGEVFTMQMKEAQPSDKLWDTPEVLEPLSMSEISTYFSIDEQQVQTMLARQDRVLVMAHVNPDYVNLNPKLDSEYLAFIYQGANTIYKVSCSESK